LTDDLAELLNREKIRDCIARVARGEDRRNAELLVGGFWPDADVDVGIFAGGFDSYLAWVVPGSSAIPVTQHVLGQSLIDVRGHRALVETHVLSYHRVVTDAEARDVVIGGRYLDRMQRRDSEWRIGQRTMLYDWLQDVGGSVDWSGGVLGVPFRGAHYTGRAVGDHSEPLLDRRPWTEDDPGCRD